MNGYELARHLKVSERLSGIPLVFVTSVTNEKSRRQANELGITQLIHKPFHETQLLKAIESVVPSEFGH
jgi:chemosensory pili system protein ChpA (sensor histidine kinase/response regulator)